MLACLAILAGVPAALGLGTALPARDPPSHGLHRLRSSAVVAAAAATSRHGHGQERDLGRRDTDPTVNFQVAMPVTIPAEATICATQTLMSHSFANAYGKPFVGRYTPPSCDFNSVVINFTSTSVGRQFDRLASMYLTDTEVWRTSTAEPSQKGIVWNYVKDMTQYTALWRQPQTVVFEMDNVVSDVYTGVYDTNLTATFFTVADPPAVADAVLPISKRLGSGGQQSIWKIPDDGNATTSYRFPPNATRATVSISSNGQIDEEFWYTNVFTPQTATFNKTVGTFLGGGPFREIQLLIDGLLAGVVWPFPVMFTGGIVPALWRPVAGIQAFDLADSEIDITPFLPMLTDGTVHEFSLRVLQLADNAGAQNGDAQLTTVESYWPTSAKIFLFYGKTTTAAGHAPPTIAGVDPTIQVTSHIAVDAKGANMSLTYTTAAQRDLQISSPAGSFRQTLEYSNAGQISAGGLVQTTMQTTTGTHESVNVLTPSYNQHLTYSYPLSLSTAVKKNSDGNGTVDANLTRGWTFTDSGRPDLSVYTLVAGPATLDTRSVGTAHISSVVGNKYNYGTTEQSFAETTAGGKYNRVVKMVNGTVVLDSLARR
ncbi:hypothetical protein P8C59_009130 [Phyllachora maydis]|uniref:Peptide N-acetyl-beta-D-glucosaminyl asparaginase amidase A N-terminal domain-containing protein n=1 Tax=Phyllachora maydis TaxID=1825666 RepID=A0AAD9ICW1_9PEZI|nr:hypothetical protein P8C59_009130 [Phyllachora maydis]